MKSYLESMKDRILNVDDIRCDYPRRLKGKPILDVEDVDFCSDPVVRKSSIMIACVLCGLGLVLAVVAFLVHRYRVRIHTVLHVHPFDRDECDGEDMKLDCFIFSDPEDRDRAREIRGLLEENAWRVCYDEDDFLGGRLLSRLIRDAIVGSKRYLCLLSDNFVQNSHCMETFMQVPLFLLHAILTSFCEVSPYF